jgi:hypothetical protein
LEQANDGTDDDANDASCNASYRLWECKQGKMHSESEKRQREANATQEDAEGDG